MWHVIGHERAVSALQFLLEQDRLPHALLFTGPPGIGKTTLAVELARASNCVGENPPCGQCVHCRQIESGAHPDVTVVEPVEGKNSISIEQVRDLREGAALRPFQGRFKVYIIAGAEALTAQAADALLKTLEEPLPHVRIILTATEADGLPATVVSRCRIVSLLPVDAATVRDALLARGAEVDRADSIARLSRGSTGWALRALESPKLLSQRDEMLVRMSAIFSMNTGERLDFAESLTAEKKDRGGVRQNLELLLLLARDLLFLMCDVQPALASGESLQRLRVASRVYSLPDVDRCLHALSRVMDRIESNVDPRLALEAMLLSLP